MLGIKAIWAILAGFVVVGGVGTYVFLENSNTEIQATQVVGNPAVTALETSKPEVDTQLPADEAVSQDESSDNSAVVDDAKIDVSVSSDEPTKNWKMPAFDVLRVEPDGSTVIAGRGQPNTTLKVMNGDEVLNEVKIGSTGDFAVIFDQPLGSGDYQLTLKIEDEDGNTLVSEETATVSVPEDANGQLLAMVTKPGQASRILAQPEAPIQSVKEIADKVEEEVDVAANTVVVDDSAEVKQVMPATEVVKQMQDDDEVKIAELIEGVETASDTSQLNADKDEVVVKLDSGDAAVVVDDAVTEKLTVTEMAKADDVSEGVEIVKDEVVQITTDLAEKTEEAVAKVQEQNVEASSQTSMETTPETIATEVQPQTNSIVRIEAVEVEGDKLFVAGVASKGNTVRILVDGKEVGAVDVNGEGRFLIETQQKLSVGPHEITAALEDKSTKKIVLRAVVPFNRPEAESAAAIAGTEVASNDVEDRTTLDADKQDDAAAIVNDASQAMDKVDVKPDATTTKTDGAVEMNKDEPQTIVQDTLTPAASQSVIIRKGDTLWQIARRTYGAGVRYTTIYLANQEQIQNPDEIEPGQIFMVPEEALENAEELHLKRLQGN